jgi:hypothetical protein
MTTPFLTALNGTLTDSIAQLGAMPGNLRSAAGISNPASLRTLAGMGDAASIRTLAGMSTASDIRTLSGMSTASDIRTLAGMATASDIRSLAGLGSPSDIRAAAGLVTGQYYNVLDYGAIGDGVFRALSSLYGSLAAAQAVYPRATALTESLDWHAHQKAIDAALSAGGGNLYSPRGKYKMTPCPDSLIFPLFDEIGTTPVASSTRAQVNWVGDGEGLTYIYWDADSLGSTVGTVAAVRCGTVYGVGPAQTAESRYASNANSSGVFKDLFLVGPARVLAGSNTIDTDGCAMTGIWLAPRRRLEHVRISWFWAGADMATQDHTPHYDVFISRCYYGIYFNYRSTSMYGDCSFGGKCMIDSCRMACIAVHPGGWFNNWHFWGRVFLGNTPYGILCEATAAPKVAMPSGGTVRNPNDWMAACRMDTVFFEGIGNIAIADDNWRVSGTSRNMPRNVWTQCTLSTWNDSKRIATHDRCFMQVGAQYGLFFEYTLWSVQSTGAVTITKPYFNFVSGTGATGGIQIVGDIEALATACTGVGVDMVGITEQQATKVILEHVYDNPNTSGYWRGRIYPVYGAVAKGDVVCTNFYGVKPAAQADTGKIVVGIARSAASVTGQRICVAEWGSMIPCNTTGTVTGQQLRELSTTAGSLQAGTAVNSANRCIGWAINSTNVNLFNGVR